MGYPTGRATIKVQSHNLLQGFRTLQKLILNDSSHRAKETDNKNNKGQKYYRKLWLCVVMAARPFGLYTSNGLSF